MTLLRYDLGMLQYSAITATNVSSSVSVIEIKISFSLIFFCFQSVLIYLQ